MKKAILLSMLFISSFLIKAQTNHWSQVGLIEFPHNNSAQTTGMGRICSMTHHPTDSNIVYAISSQGGLWRSTNGGVSWGPMTDHFPRSKFACFTLNHKNTNTMYIGTGDPNAGGGGAGIWKSVNGGKTWTQINKNIEKEQIYSIIIHQNDTNHLVALSRQGIYKSYDGGLNWVRKTTKAGSQDLIRKAGSLTGLYYCSSRDFSYSNDFGETWTTNELIPGDTMGGILICSSNLDTNLVYAVAWRTNSWGSKTHFGGLFKSKDGGQTWKLQSDRPQIMGYSSTGSTDDGQGRYNMAITVDPLDAGHIFVGAINLWESKDSGKTWILNSKWGNGIHADKHYLGYSPHNKKKVFVAHDGGVDLSRNNGVTWENASNFLAVTEFYIFAQSPSKKELMIGGTQDNGKYFYIDSIFYNTGAGDVLVDFTFPDKDSLYIYANYTDKRYHVYEQKYYPMNGIISDATFEQNRKFKNILYMCNKDLYVTLDINATTISWTKISNPSKHFGTIGTVDIEACKSNPNMLYWGKSNNVLYLIRNVNSGSPSFTQLTIPSGTLKQICTHVRDSNIVYIVVNDKLYRSSDKGSTWTSLQYNLPALEIIKFVPDDRMTDSSMYLCTAFQVYYRNKNMNSWLSIQTDRPTMALITDMEIFNDSSTKSCLRISTYGRGLWQTGLTQFQNSAPEAEFSFQRLDADCPDNLILNDVSLGSSYKRRWQIIPYGAYQYKNGTDSLSATPEIYFNQKGEFLVTLYVENNLGRDSITKVFHSMKEKTYATCNVHTRSLGNFGYGITSLEFGNIRSKSPYSLQQTMNTENLTCGDYAHVRPGATYSSAVSNNSGYSENATLFIDYNDDGDFYDVNERVVDYPFGSGRRTANVTIISNPPVTGKLIRMRIISDNSKIKSPCDTVRYGQAEDYLLLIDTSVLINMNVPKPKVYGNFNVNLSLNHYCPKFDVSKIKLKNARLLNYRRINPLKYELTLSPIKPGKINIELQSGTFFDQAGNPNLVIRDSTLFEMGLIQYSFPNVCKRTEISHNDTGGIIDCYVYHGTILTYLIADFSLTDSCKAFIGTTRQYTNVTANDFSQPVSLMIQNIDGTFKKKYTINVIELPDTVCELLSFSFNQPYVNGNISGTNVTLTVPYGTNLSNRVAYTTVSNGSKIKVNNIDELSGVTMHDFRQPLVYRVYAEDTTYFKDYTVNVSIEKNNKCDLLNWAVVNPFAKAVITPVDTTSGLVHVTVPFKTDLTQLIALFNISDSAKLFINNQIQISNISQQDYTDTVVAKVISQDQKHSKTYKIVIKRAPNNECKLLSYNLTTPNIIGNIIDKDTYSLVILTLPYKIAKTDLKANFTISENAQLTIGQQVQISGTTINQYQDTLLAIVVSQDKLNYRIYNIIAKYAPNDSCEMLTFSIKSPKSIGSFTRDITGGSIEIKLPQNTDITQLVAEFSTSDSALVEINGNKQLNGQNVNDFTNAVVYKVWSQSKKFSKEYTVIVNRDNGLNTPDPNQFEIYPNPAGEYAILQIKDPSSEFTIQIIDVNGKIVLTYDNTTHLDIRSLKAGTYTVQFITKDQVLCSKLIKK